jgi:CRP/FNR family transcriptional regulator
MARRTLAEAIPWGSIPIFQSLRPEEMERLRPLALLREFERNEQLFDQGDPSEWLHFLVEGRMKILRRRPDGNDLILEILGPGDPVGIVAALEGSPFPAAAVVHERCRILSLPKRDFLDFLERHPPLVRSLLAGLCSRQLLLARRLADFPGTVEARIARLFLTLATRTGEKEDDGFRIPIALSRQEIADLVGTTLESAIRVLSRWGKEGIVLTHRDGFSVPSLNALEARTEPDRGV